MKDDEVLLLWEIRSKYLIRPNKQFKLSVSDAEVRYQIANLEWANICAGSLYEIESLIAYWNIFGKNTHFYVVRRIKLLLTKLGMNIKIQRDVMKGKLDMVSKLTKYIANGDKRFFFFFWPFYTSIIYGLPVLEKHSSFYGPKTWKLLLCRDCIHAGIVDTLIRPFKYIGTDLSLYDKTFLLILSIRIPRLSSDGSVA